jgi:hypothetical protein
MKKNSNTDWLGALNQQEMTYRMSVGDEKGTEGPECVS